jgi:LAS superfamily LD-carboxypeptidase LdcB
VKRSIFLKTLFYSGIGASLLPSWSFTPYQSPYTREQLIGKNNPDIIGQSYTSKMHKDAKAAFEKMKAAAAKENIKIEVVSAYRDFERQKEIFEGKYDQFIRTGLSPIDAIEKIIEYSTIPGTSRHHWGTDLDLIDGNTARPKNVLQPEHFHGKGPFCKLKEWMDLHSESFGFFEVYTDNPLRKGFKYEPWHFSYAPVSKPMLSAYRQLDIKAILLEEKIKGAAYFSEAFISDYVSQQILDINPKLL